MMNSLILEKDKKTENNIIKDVRNLFRLKKEIDGNTLKIWENLLEWKKKPEVIKDRIISDIRYLFEPEK